MAEFITRDSGERRTFPTGSVRDVRTGKGRYDLVPPEAMRRLTALYERGADKYGDRNWERGQDIGSYLDSLIRHAFDYLAGDREEDHLAAVAWNAFAAMTTEERMPELQDIPSRKIVRKEYTHNCWCGYKTDDFYELLGHDTNHTDEEEQTNGTRVHSIPRFGSGGGRATIIPRDG